MIDDEETVVSRLRWFKFPLLVLALGVASIAFGWAGIFEIVPAMMILIIPWMAWSIISGLYPWSMRL